MADSMIIPDDDAEESSQGLTVSQRSTSDNNRVLRQRLAGVGVAITTPFNRGARVVDVGALKSNVTWLVHEGIKLFYPCGSTGEFRSLSLEEWMKVVETTIECAPQATVVPGVGGALPQAHAMAGSAAKMGATAMLLMPLEHPGASEAGIVAYYSSLAQDSALPSVLYRKGEHLGLSAMQEILRGSSIVGVKYATNDLRELTALIRLMDDEVQWFCGVAEAWAPFYRLAGATGFTSGIANFAPHLALALSEALRRDSFKEAMNLAGRALPFEIFRSRDGDRYSVSAVKYAMDLTGLCGGPVRSPLSVLGAKDKAAVREMLGSLAAQ